MRRSLSGPKREGGRELKTDLDKKTSQERKLSFISYFKLHLKNKMIAFFFKTHAKAHLHLGPGIELVNPNIVYPRNRFCAHA